MIETRPFHTRSRHEFGDGGLDPAEVSRFINGLLRLYQPRLKQILNDRQRLVLHPLRGSCLRIKIETGFARYDTGNVPEHSIVVYAPP